MVGLEARDKNTSNYINWDYDARMPFESNSNEDLHNICQLHKKPRKTENKGHLLFVAV